MNALKLAALVLPLLAVDASAIAVYRGPISPRINPLVNLPVTLPNPITGPLAGRGVTLPSPVLAPTPVLLAPTPLLLAPALQGPAELPTAAPLAAAPVAPRVTNLPAVLPEGIVLMAPADAKKAAPALAAAPLSPRAADELRNLFDGSRKPSDIAWEPILPRDRQPVPARRHGLPEDELERELGVDPNF